MTKATESVDVARGQNSSPAWDGYAFRRFVSRLSARARVPAAWWRPADPIVLVIAAVCVVVYSLRGFHGALTRDLGVYSYAGQQVADGVPPYLGILNRAGPLAHVLPGVGVMVARLGEFDDVVTMRVLFMLIATASVCAIYLLGRDLFGSRPAGMVAAGTLLAFHGFIHYASNGPREKTPMTLFIIVEDRTRAAAGELARDALETATASGDRPKVELEAESLGDLHDRGKAGVAIG